MLYPNAALYVGILALGTKLFGHYNAILICIWGQPLPLASSLASACPFCTQVGSSLPGFLALVDSLRDRTDCRIAETKMVGYFNQLVFMLPNGKGDAFIKTLRW